MFHVFKDLVPDHDTIRTIITYRTYKDFDADHQSVLTFCIYPMESDTMDTNQLMNHIGIGIREWLELDNRIQVYPTTNNLYFNVNFKTADSMWNWLRDHLLMIEANNEKITVNYHVSSNEYEIIIPSSEDFTYTTIILVGLKDIGLLRLLGINDLSLITEYLRQIQFNEDSGDLSMAVSFVRMVPDTIDDSVPESHVVKVITGDDAAFTIPDMEIGEGTKELILESLGEDTSYYVRHKHKV